MGFSRQKYWSGLPFSPSGDLPDPGIEPYIGRGILYCWAQMVDLRLLTYLGLCSDPQGPQEKLTLFNTASQMPSAALQQTCWTNASMSPREASLSLDTYQPLPVLARAQTRPTPEVSPSLAPALSLPQSWGNGSRLIPEVALTTLCLIVLYL